MKTDFSNHRLIESAAMTCAKSHVEWDFAEWAPGDEVPPMPVSWMTDYSTPAIDLADFCDNCTLDEINLFRGKVIAAYREMMMAATNA